MRGHGLPSNHLLVLGCTANTSMQERRITCFVSTEAHRTPRTRHSPFGEAFSDSLPKTSRKDPTRLRVDFDLKHLSVHNALVGFAGFVPTATIVTMGLVNFFRKMTTRTRTRNNCAWTTNVKHGAVNPPSLCGFRHFGLDDLA